MRIKHFVAVVVVAISFLLPLEVMPAYAANISITGGTNGAACDSGGYFTPSSVTINSGDTLTISVPANDPYEGGLEVHGFPQGSFVVARGSSVTTNPITANVNYYGTWPSSGCMKGSGTIAVSTPPVTPPNPTPSTTPPSTPPTATTPTSPQPGSSTDMKAPTSTPPATKLNTSSQPATQNSTSRTPSSSSSSPAFENIVAVSGGILAAVILLAVVVWRLLLRRR